MAVDSRDSGGFKWLIGAFFLATLIALAFGFVVVWKEFQQLQIIESVKRPSGNISYTIGWRSAGAMGEAIYYLYVHKSNIEPSDSYMKMRFEDFDYITVD